MSKLSENGKIPTKSSYGNYTFKFFTFLNTKEEINNVFMIIMIIIIMLSFAKTISVSIRVKHLINLTTKNKTAVYYY